MAMLSAEKVSDDRSASGFTLVEIMIVVALVGLLAGWGVMSVQKAMHNSKNKAAETQLHMLSAGVLQLAWDTGRWPNGNKRTEFGGSEVADLSSADAGLLMADTNNVFNGWQGPYYNDGLEDPWGRNYFFSPSYAVAGGGAVVVSLGQDGIRSSDDIWVDLN